MKVASYALFGNHVTYGTRQFYWDHIPATVRAHHNLLPDWELRIHVDSLYDDDRSKLLRAFEKAGLLRVIHAEENIACCRSMLWRMMPVWDKDVTHVLCRDIDSIMCPKDVKVVTQWVQSGATLSVVNDNPAHSVTMMGGMVGFRTDTFLAKSPWPTWLAMIEAHEGLHLPSGGYDQILMSNSIWNHYYPDVCAHRFSGMPQDGRLKACYQSVPEGPIAGLDPEMCRQADALMPYLGTCGYPIDKAIKIFDDHGNPEVRDRVVTAEQNA
jgi:hypothetical protein